MIDISRYSGKSDLADTCDIFGIDEIISKYKIYAHGNILPLKIEKPSDIVPYYPYLTASMSSSKEDGGVIYLSSQSYVDEEETRHLQLYLDLVKKYWRKCKRNKMPFDEDEALKKICWMTPKDYEKEIVRRVKEQGEKATIDGIHYPMSDYYRNELYKEMIANGWDDFKAYQWCFGWERAYEKIRKEQQEKSAEEASITDKESKIN